MSAIQKMKRKNCGMRLQRDLPMSSTRWSMGTCSNEVDSSTRFELEDSMNPLQAVAVLARDSLCGYNQGCLFLMIRGFNSIWTNTISLPSMIRKSV